MAQFAVFLLCLGLLLVAFLLGFKLGWEARNQ
jgi:hypothetical protein